jgi:monoamine oxidase
MRPYTEQERIENGLRIGDETVGEFCQTESESFDEEAALLALFQTSVTALRYRGWSIALLAEHFALGIEQGDQMLTEDGIELPEEPTQQ